MSASTMTVDTPYPKAVEQFPTIRQSLLAEFDLCSLEAKFGMEYTRGWATHPQARGRLFHTFAAKALTAMNEMNEPTIEIDVALAILMEVLRQDDVDRECPVCESTEIAPGIKGGMRTCSNGHRFESEFVNIPMREVEDLYWIVKKWGFDNRFDIENLVDVEKRLSAALVYVKDGVSVTRVLDGQLDVLFVEGDYDEHAIVIDWKDTWALPPPTEVSFEGYFQQRMYGWLVMRNYKGIEGVTLREFYPRYSEPREATVYRDKLDDIEQELSALVERFDRAVEEDVWTPTPGKHCSYCPRPTACPIPRAAREQGKIETQAQAEQAARQLIVATSIVDQNKKALESWANTHGPIPMRDAKGYRVWGHRESKRTERPTRDALEQALRHAGGDPSRVNLNLLYTTKSVTRFEPHVPKPERETEEDSELLAKLQESVSEAKAKRASEG
jgi:PD-(D/E)XK nuclease superfamily